MTFSSLSLIYLERKFIGRIQMRLGPMRVGPYGTLQSIADAIKLVSKEDLRPHTADRWVFELAPYVVFIPSFLTFVSLPFTADWFVRNLELGLFYIVAVSGVSVVGVVMAGWGSDNRYALLGGVRAAAQLISYEIPLILSVLAVVMISGSMDLVEIVDQQGRVPNIAWQPLGFLIFFIAALAELYRNPFDIPVAETEVVGGPFIEYSGIRWGMFFLAEYTSLLILSVLASLIFLGGWNWPLGNEVGIGLQIVWTVLKTAFIIVLFFWARATFPRLRIDQLMSFSWQVLLPLSFLQIIINGLSRIYDWPDIVLLISSGAATALALYLVYASVQRIQEPYPQRFTTVMTRKEPVG